MKPGDLVHNVPYDTFGVIISELEPIADEYGRVAERRFMVLYNKPLHPERSHPGNGMYWLTGSTYLAPAERLCHRHHADQKREGERCC